jgi:hypothetical protein
LIKIDLEDLVKRKRLQVKHADYVIILSNTAIIIEETSRPKLDDVEKLNKTRELIREGLLEPEIPKNLNKTIGVIHRSQGIDAPVTKIARSRGYAIVNCDKSLNEFLQKLKE